MITPALLSHLIHIQTSRAVYISSPFTASLLQSGSHPSLKPVTSRLPNENVELPYQRIAPVFATANNPFRETTLSSNVETSWVPPLSGLFFTYLLHVGFCHLSPYLSWLIWAIHMISATTYLLKPPYIHICSPHFWISLPVWDAFPPRYLLKCKESKLIFLLTVCRICRFNKPTEVSLPLRYPTHVITVTVLLIYMLPK